MQVIAKVALFGFCKVYGRNLKVYGPIWSYRIGPVESPMAMVLS